MSESVETPAPDLTWLPTDDTHPDTAARLYAENGWLVIPVHGTAGEACACRSGVECPNPGKHPIGKAWQKNASSDPSDVADARRGHRITPNVGLAMGGKLRRITVDIDGAVGRASWQTITEGRHVPRTTTSRSGRLDGGEHLLFDVPARLDIAKLKNRAGVLADGLDVRAEGGQIVAPPSMHASGRRYSWTDRAPVAELPEWLFDELTKEAPPKHGKTASSAPSGDATPRARSDARLAKYWASVLDNAQRDVSAQREGGRNQILFDKACKLYELCIGEGFSKSEASSVLEAASRSTGLGLGEIRKALDSAWSKVEHGGGKRMPDLQVHEGGTSRGAPVAAHKPPPEDWDDEHEKSGGKEAPEDNPLAALQRDNHRMVKKTTANVALLLEHHDDWAGVLAFDDFEGRAVKMRPTPEAYGHKPRGVGPWGDEDTGRAVMWLAANFRLDVKATMVEDAVAIVAAEHVVHPVRDYFNGLVWDGTARLDTWLSNYCGAEPTDYVKGAGARWVISAVARIFEPGCKADLVLVLEGEQGVGKSTALRTLVGDAWFSDTLPQIGDKDAMQALRGRMVFELGELAAMKGREVEKVKAFFTTQIDAYRPSYGRRTVTFPRQCVFAATTNDEHYLTDRTGNRRFVPVVCDRVDVAGLARDRDQLWAEAVARYRAGERWHADASFAALAAAQLEEREEEDSWDDALREWLANPVLLERGSDGLTREKKADGRLGFRMLDALAGTAKVVGRPPMRTEERRMAACFRKLGYERATVGQERARLWRPKVFKARVELALAFPPAAAPPVAQAPGGGGVIPMIAKNDKLPEVVSEPSSEVPREKISFSKVQEIGVGRDHGDHPPKSPGELTRQGDPHDPFPLASEPTEPESDDDDPFAGIEFTPIGDSEGITPPAETLTQNPHPGSASGVPDDTPCICFAEPGTGHESWCGKEGQA